MKKMTGSEIRKMWLDFFRSKGHEIIPSAPLIPYEDPTLLWINAGIAPLKKFFDGREKPNNPRMANAQKSIRTNDIDNVGKTARHHTFFEMLGNFSIGDYFRDEALTWAYELLFSPKWYGFDVEKLYFTYYPTDFETRDLWIKLGVDPSHLVPLEGNFWEIGEGPCGPDTEIFFDRGEKYDPNHLGIKMLQEEIENDRYIEIWNIVFSQYNAKPGLNREEYPELPSKNIDTGMGLERMACVIQEVKTNYDTDLFLPMIEFLEKYTGIAYEDQMSFRVIVDHIRSVTFALADGATFSNESRGYVLRRLLRRAVRYGQKLGIHKPFLYNLVPIVASIMEDFYPYLEEKQEVISKMIKIEEENFLKTLENGEKRLLEMIEQANSSMLSGAEAFLLYDTFGFPLELTMEIVEEHKMKVDVEGFNEQLKKQKQRARESRSTEQSMNVQNEDYLKFNKKSEFVGYETLHTNTTVIGLFVDGKSASVAKNQAVVIAKSTPFYAESGGQVGDTGTLRFGGDDYEIINTFKLPNDQHAHLVNLEDTLLKLDDEIELQVDKEKRLKIACNHTATHLLNQSLRNHLGPHVVQQGSHVGSERLRFDFNHYENLTNEQILSIEKEVNEVIRKGYPVQIIETSMEEAKKRGAQALFGEKYGKVVRLVDNQFSAELCGGTHVSNTKEIQKFAILSIESKGSGIFRIEATTNDSIKEEMAKTLEHYSSSIDSLKERLKDIINIATQAGFTISKEPIPEFKQTGSYQDVITIQEVYNNMVSIVKNAEKEFDQLYRKEKSSNYNDFFELAEFRDDTMYLITKVDGYDISVLKDIVDKIAAEKEKALIFFADVIDEEKIIFVAKAKGIKANCGMLVKKAAQATGGNGGGRPDFAQAGGKDLDKLDDALKSIKSEFQL